MTSIDIQIIEGIVRAASTHMDRTGGFEVHDKGVRENIVTSSALAVQHFLTEAGGTVRDFDGNKPSLFHPSMLVAANTEDSCERVLKTIHNHLSHLPYE